MARGYEDIVNRIVSGERVDQMELQALAYGLVNEPNEVPVDAKELLDQAESSGDEIASRQANQALDLMKTAGNANESVTNQLKAIGEGRNLDTPDSSLGGIAAGTAGALGAAAAPSILRAIAPLASRLPSVFNLGKGSVGRKVLGIGTAVTGGFALAGGGDETTPDRFQTTPQGTSPRPDEDKVVAVVPDPTGELTGTPGGVASLTQSQLNALGGPQGSALDSALQPAGYSDGLTGLLSGLNIDPSSYQNYGGGNQETLDVTMAGSISLKDPIALTFGVNRPRIVPSGQGSSTTRTVGGSHPIGTIEGREKTVSTTGLTEEERITQRVLRNEAGVPNSGRPDDRVVPAGSKIAPRALQMFQGKSLIEWAGEAAARWQVPLNLLYGLVNLESNWNPNAVGDNGQSHGLVQIYSPAWPNISVAQKNDPRFALNWAAQKLRERFNQYGRWDAAVAAHNSPVAANHLASTGEFYNSKSRWYTETILGYANESGLADYIFDTGALGADTMGAGGTEPEPPAQVTPDPAKLREYTRQVFSQMLGRQPTEEEIATSVKQLQSFYDEAYANELRQWDNETSEAVAPEARFEEQIAETGEFQFVQDKQQNRSFFDFASEAANILRRA